MCGPSSSVLISQEAGGLHILQQPERHYKTLSRETKDLPMLPGGNAAHWAPNPRFNPQHHLHQVYVYDIPKDINEHQPAPTYC